MQRRLLRLGLVISLCLLPACSHGRGQVGAWHPVTAAPGPIPNGVENRFWAGGEMIFFGNGDVRSLAYRPADDTWRFVAEPPPPGLSGWTFVGAGDVVVGVSRDATVVYTPRTDSWRTRPGPPLPADIDRYMSYSPWLAWTGKFVALSQPWGDGFAAFDVKRGRWRRLPSIGRETGSHWLLSTTAGLVNPGSPVLLLAPGARRWQALPDLPPQMEELAPGTDFVFAGGLIPGTNTHARGRYLLPSGRWEPLPPSPIWTGARAKAVDGGLIALWYGTATDRAERPNGALLRPGRDTWEVIPPPPGPVWGGELLAAGRDLLLLTDDEPRQLVARYSPGDRSAAPPTVPVAAAGPCTAASTSAQANGDRSTHNYEYIVTLVNQSDVPCTLAGPVVLTAIDAAGREIAFSGGQSVDGTTPYAAVPGFGRGGQVTVKMSPNSGVAPSRTRPECVGAPRAARLFLSWQGSGGRAEIGMPAADVKPPMCNVSVTSFEDAWPAW